MFALPRSGLLFGAGECLFSPRGAGIRFQQLLKKPVRTVLNTRGLPMRAVSNFFPTLVVSATTT